MNTLWIKRDNVEIELTEQAAIEELVLHALVIPQNDLRFFNFSDGIRHITDLENKLFSERENYLGRPDFDIARHLPQYAEAYSKVLGIINRRTPVPNKEKADELANLIREIGLTYTLLLNQPTKES